MSALHKTLFPTRQHRVKPVATVGPFVKPVRKLRFRHFAQAPLPLPNQEEFRKSHHRAVLPESVGLPTPKKSVVLHNHRRFIKFMVVLSVSPKSLGVVCHGCVSHRHGPVFSPTFCFQNMEPCIQVGFLDLRAFAGFCGCFAVILGAAVCIYMRWCSGYENGLVCHWDAAMMQAMFSRIQNVNCGDSVATGKQNQANYYSRIRRDSENWVVLGHTPKLPKIIDRRNVQVEFEFRNFFGTPWLKVAGTCRNYQYAIDMHRL